MSHSPLIIDGELRDASIEALADVLLEMADSTEPETLDVEVAPSVEWGNSITQQTNSTI